MTNENKLQGKGLRWAMSCRSRRNCWCKSSVSVLSVLVVHEKTKGGYMKLIRRKVVVLTQWQQVLQLKVLSRQVA